MKYILFLLLLSACNSKKETSKSAFTGNWEYKTIEFYSGEKFDLTDSMFTRLHQQHVGLNIRFSGKTFSAWQKKPGKPDESMGRQDYELVGDSILRLINTGRPHDEFPIISITDSILKLNLFNSPMGYVVFRKVD